VPSAETPDKFTGTCPCAVACSLDRYSFPEANFPDLELTIPVAGERENNLKMAYFRPLFCFIALLIRE
jgi:hypothetical protein